MNVTRTIVAGLLVMLPLTPVAAVRPAAAGDVVLYEMTETLLLKTRTGSSTSALMGRATVGTPICPPALIAQLNPGAAACSVIVSGADSLNRTRGTGKLSGGFNVAVQTDTPADAPGLVVAEGQFDSKLTYAPTMLQGVPYGTVSGMLRVTPAGTRVPFTGVFRLPFLGNHQPYGADGPTMREIFCPLSSSPNVALGGEDLVWLDTTSGLPNGRCIDIAPSERALGVPVVRFDMTFAGNAAATPVAAPVR